MTRSRSRRPARARGTDEPAGAFGAADRIGADDPVVDGEPGGRAPAGRPAAGWLPGCWRRRDDLLTVLPRCGGTGERGREARDSVVAGCAPLREGTVPRNSRVPSEPSRLVEVGSD